MLCEAHKNKLLLHYGINPERPEVQDLEKAGQLKTVTSEEIEALSGWRVDGPGIYIGYPGNRSFVIRSPEDAPKEIPKYLHPRGEPNHLFVPPGFDLAKAQDLWITEGELKALCGFLQGLPIVALGGVYSWRTSGEEAELLPTGEKLKDEEALLPELAQASWEGKSIALLYDSDIVPGHRAYDAYPRLAEQLYRLGAGEVRILTLPSINPEGKTGLDDFIKTKGPEQALQDLQAIRNRAEPYLPTKAGGPAYAERLIKSKNPEDRLKAAIAILGAKKEFFARAWLNEHGLLKKDSDLLIKEAKTRLKELQAKPRTSSQASPSQELGPEYEHVKTLLQPLLSEKYGMDKLGRLGRYEWETYYEDGQEVKELVHKNFCNFAAWPIREILKDSGAGEPERFLELQGLLPGGIPLRPRAISITEFLEKPSSCLGKAWGVNAAIKPKKDQELRYLLQLMANGIPETTVYAHLGWREINGSWVYLHAGGAIGSDSVEVEINERLKRYALPEASGNPKEAIQASLSLLELGPKKIMYSLLALVYLAPLCEPLRQAGIEPSLLTYIWGPTGSKKSTLIALLLSHYGNFDPKGLPASFRDTANSIEKLAFLAKDTILSVDDLYPAKEPREKARLEGVLEHLSRNQGDRTGKGRMKADTSLREGLPPRGLALCSGEVMPLSGSSLARGFIHRLQKGEIDLEKLSQAQAQKTLLSQAMRGYLEYLAPQMDALPSQLEGAFTQLRQEANKKDPSKSRHSRLNESISHLHLGLKAFVTFAVSLEAISREDGERLLQEGWDIFNEIADEQTKLEKAGEPSKKIAEASMELEAQGKIYWANMEDTPGFLQGSVKVGWKDEGRGIYYTNLGTLLKEVTQHLKGQGENIYISGIGFKEYLNQNGLLVEKNRNRDQKTIRIKDNTEKPKLIKTYAIAAKFFEEGGEE